LQSAVYDVSDFDQCCQQGIENGIFDNKNAGKAGKNYAAGFSE
jgi:hypothetical protein